MKKLINLDLENPEKSAELFRALSLPARLRMIREIVQAEKGALGIAELAVRLGLPLSTTALHARALERAGILVIQEKPGLRGTQRVCTVQFDDVYFRFLSQRKDDESRMRRLGLSMPVGNYCDFSVTKTCGLAGRHSVIGEWDSPDSFYNPNHFQAQLIWFTTGFLEYRFSNQTLRNETILELCFSFEACSEALGHNNDWPSDITIWINREEVFQFRSDGDYGGTRGRNTPEWWSNINTQYGELHRMVINASGCYSDNRTTSNHNLRTLHIAEGSHISFIIGVKENAEHAGGLNLFGEHFGNYNTNIEMTAKVER
jgi:predicted transcriptional regulator